MLEYLKSLSALEQLVCRKVELLWKYLRLVGGGFLSEFGDVEERRDRIAG